MRITFDLVSQPHPLCRRGQIARLPNGQLVWDEDDEDGLRSHHAVRALDGDRLVGVLKFNARRTPPKGMTLRSIGTFVWPRYRAEGVGVRLWEHALAAYPFTQVEVVVISDKGKTLVESLRNKFGWLEFNMLEQGGRSLRDLKGKKVKNLRKAA